MAILNENPDRRLLIAQCMEALPELYRTALDHAVAGRHRQFISGAVVGRTPTQWVLQGADTFRFSVSRNKKLSIVE